MIIKTPSTVLLFLPLLVSIASAGPIVDAAAAGADASAAGTPAGAAAVTAVPAVAGAPALGALSAPALAAPSAASLPLPSAAAAAPAAALPAPALAAPAAAALAPGNDSAAAPTSSARAASPTGRAAGAPGAVSELPASAANDADGAAAGRVRFDGQDARIPSDAAAVPAASAAAVPAYVTEYRRLTKKVADNERRRRDYMNSVPAGTAVGNELLAIHEERIAPEYDADSRALAALVKAHPNVKYEAAGHIRRLGMQMLGRGPEAPAYVTEFRRLVDKIAGNERERREFLASLPAADSLREDLLGLNENVLAPEFRADERALAALVKEHPNVEYEAAGALRRLGMRLAGNGPLKEAAPAPGTARFHGRVFPVASFNQDWLIRGIDASNQSVELSVTERDLTPELIAALVRAKKRRVSLTISGSGFSDAFLYGPAQRRLRDAGLVVHYKIGISEPAAWAADPSGRGLIAVYDHNFVMRESPNYSRTAGDRAYVVESDPQRVTSFDEAVRAGWAQGTEAPSRSKKP